MDADRKIMGRDAGSSLRIVGLYAAFGALWIIFSDTALYSLVKDPWLATAIATAKGWLYVLVTSLLLLSLVARELSRRGRLEAALRERLDEKEILLREVHHRVNNNLQIVGSILGLERELLETEADRLVMDASKDRVLAMGIVHGSLSRRDDLAHVDLDAWLGEIAPELAGAYQCPPPSSFDLARLQIGMDRAMPIGLVFAEALSNAARHGGGTPVHVSLRLLPSGKARLEVRDGGPGFPEERKPREGGIGLLLAETLAAQISGSFECRNEGGGLQALEFPLSAQPEIGGAS